MAKPISKKIGGFAVTAWVCIFAGPMLLLGSFIFDGNTINYFLSADLKGWLIVAFLGLIMQPIAYGIMLLGIMSYYLLRGYGT